MVDYESLRKKFQAKRPKDAHAKGPLHAKSSKAAVRAIQLEYERKKADLQSSSVPGIRKGPVFYGAIILILLAVGGLVFSAARDGDLTLGKRRVERKALQARKSMDALSVALGRYKFHVGSYPSTEEGLAMLAVKASRKRGWDGPYVNHIVPDPWGHEYVYETRPEGGHPVLYSKGADGKAGTTDDVMPDQESFDAPFRDTTWTNHWAPYRLRGIVVAPDEETKARVQAEMKKYD